jgi:hypothetical protein
MPQGSTVTGLWTLHCGKEVLRDFYNKQGSNNLTEPQKKMLKNASGFKKYYGVPKMLRGYRSAAGLKKSVKG